MKQHFKRVLLVASMMLAITNVTLGQTQGQTPMPKKAKLMRIFYPKTKTVGVGYVYKKQFVENQEVTFLKSNYYSEDTIVSGIYFTKNDTAYIKGFVPLIDFNRDKSIRGGIFQISNTNEGNTLTTNPKKAFSRLTSYRYTNALKIKDVDIDYYQGGFSSQNRGYPVTYPVTLQKPSDNYVLRMELKDGILETDISPDIVKKYGLEFKDLIKSSQNVKLTYKNGNVFVGAVDTYDFSPQKGEYKFKTGETYTGTIGTTRTAFGDISDHLVYCDSRIRIPHEGKIVFIDGTVANGDWLKQYNFTADEWENIYDSSNSLTEIRDMAVNLQKKKVLKQQEEKIAKERAEQEKLREKQERKRSLMAKYGDYWGELISKSEYTPGMTQEMVGEIVDKNWFIVNKSVRNSQSIDIWKYSKERMELAMLADATKGKENISNEALAGTALYISMLSSGISELLPFVVPKTLIFTNNKLTDIYK
jgi:hypothetical protein